MSGTERKRLWRLRNPEKSQAAERARSQARNCGYWGEWEQGTERRPCLSSESYQRYELSHKRWQSHIRSLRGNPDLFHEQRAGVGGRR